MPATQSVLSSNGAASKSLVLQGISKTFGDTVAVQTMDLEIQPGELVSLLGPSGCGKTTTLRMIAGFEYPDDGSILIDGNDISHLPPNKRGLGMVFQHYSLFPHMTVGENISFGLQMAGVAKDKMRREVKRMLEMIQLPEYAERKVSQLSGGQQQRVALARAIVTNPSVLLLDEPLGALDKNLREGMQTEIHNLQKNLGITSVMVTHDQEEALTMSDRIVVMSAGAVLQVGGAREVYERPRTRFVAEFLGTANILTAQVMETHVDSLAVQLMDATQTRLIVSKPAGRYPDSKIELAVRPEKIALNAVQDDHVSMDGTIVAHVFKGSQHTYDVMVPELDQTLVIMHQSTTNYGRGFAINDRVKVSFHPRDVVALESDGA